jgi:hypothetical protein
MDDALLLLTTYGPALSAVGAAVAFVWSVFQFFSVRAREARAREFETFHRLIKELVEPPAEGASLYIDRQCAVLYELRFFPRYYPFTRRTLQGLKTKWSLTAAHFPRILEEFDITLKIIDARTNSVLSRSRRGLHFSSSVDV